MKILLVNKFLYLKGGDAISTINTGKLLSGQGHKVIFWGMKHSLNPEYPWKDYFVSYIDFNKAMDFLQRFRTTLRILYSLEAKRKIEKLIKIEKPDIVHLNNFAHQISPSILDVFGKYKIPTVMTFRDYKLVCPSYSMFENGKPCEKCRNGKYFWCLFKKYRHVPWIGDYGDPWTFSPILPRIRWGRSIDKWIESKLLKAMDRVIVTTSETKKGFIENYPFLKKEKIVPISQGYDPKEFEMIQPELGNKFRIVYTGIFYDEIREPYAFFDAIKCLKDIELEVIVAGDILSHYAKAAEERGLKGKVNFLGHQPHERAIALQKGADLLLFLSNNSPYQLPGKIFEYFAASRPILVIQFDEKDIASCLLKKYNRGIVVSNKPEEIASAIKKIYEFWQKGKLNKQFRLEPMREYSWESQAKKLENVIKNVIND